MLEVGFLIIPYQAITGNNNIVYVQVNEEKIIPYQAITGNNNLHCGYLLTGCIIPYQAITGNNNILSIVSES